MDDRNISGTFNNRLGLGSTYAQHEAGVNAWDTPISAQTKIAVQNIRLYGQASAPVKKSPLYGIAYKLGQMFK